MTKLEELKGMRFGEITLWTSGTGSGKSTLLREIADEDAYDAAWAAAEESWDTYKAELKKTQKENN
jgi:predicted ATPase